LGKWAVGGHCFAVGHANRRGGADWLQGRATDMDLALLHLLGEGTVLLENGSLLRLAHAGIGGFVGIDQQYVMHGIVLSLRHYSGSKQCWCAAPMIMTNDNRPNRQPDDSGFPT